MVFLYFRKVVLYLYKLLPTVSEGVCLKNTTTDIPFYGRTVLVLIISKLETCPQYALNPAITIAVRVFFL